MDDVEVVEVQISAVVVDDAQLGCGGVSYRSGGDLTWVHLTFDHVGQVLCHADFIPLETVHLDLVCSCCSGVQQRSRTTWERRDLSWSEIRAHPSQKPLLASSSQFIHV